MPPASKLSEILRPLDPGQIRTLHLQPGSLSDPIQVTIWRMNMGKLLSEPVPHYRGYTWKYGLDGVTWSSPSLGMSTEEQNTSSRVPQYDALSYMWGPEVMKPIEIYGTTYEIRENLWQAFLHLRLETETRVLWVDAICIDQESVEERNHQVAQMGKIYARAARVLVWLGPLRPSLSNAVDWFSGLGTSPSQPWQLFQNPTLTEENIAMLQSIRHFCLHKYWERLWIVQEIVQAHTVTLHCGSRTFKLNGLVALFESIGELSTRYMLSPLSSKSEHLRRSVIRTAKECSIPAIIYDRAQMKEAAAEGWSSTGKEIEPGRPLLQLCTQYGGSKCADERDKVFGLHGFARRCCQELVPVDYGLPFAQICHTLLIHHAAEHSGMGIGLIADSRLFCHQLGITSKRFGVPGPAPEAPSSTEQASMKEPSIKAIGCVRGRIQSISSALYENTTGNLEKLDLTSPIQEQLAYFETVRETTEEKRLPITTQADLVVPLPRVSEHPITVKPNKVSSTNLDGFPGEISSSQEFNSQSEPIYNTTWLNRLDELLQDIEHRITNEVVARNCRLAFEEKGLIFLAPTNAQVGDLVCQFKYTDTLVLVRQVPGSRDKCRLVGRAMNLLATSPTMPCESFTIMPTFWGCCSSHQVEFDLDLHTLCLLSSASETPDAVSSVPPLVRKSDPSAPGMHVCD